MIKTALFTLILILGFENLWGQTKNNTNAAGAKSAAAPTFQMNGSAYILSNLVRDGISMSNNDPALVGNFWFNFGPQVRLGLSGSNVNFPGSNSTHLNLLINSEVLIEFSENSRFQFRYSLDQYYSNTSRNGTIAILKFTAFKNYSVGLNLYSNFEGRGDAYSNYSFSYSTLVFGDWNWNNIAGYNMIQTVGYTNYFNFLTEIQSRTGIFSYGAGIKGTTGAEAFRERASFGLVLQLGAEF